MISDSETTFPDRVVLSVEDLVVEYGKKKKVRAVNGMSFQVYEGECVGFIGPNGAGKSTTIKAIMGFLFPTSGKVEVFGQKAGTVASRERIGYLPEVALYYPFMKARELLELYGGLHRLRKSELRERIPKILEEVGLGGKEEVLLKNFSKGMQQRLGIAQAIIADPELMVFDELSSGLDPIGRHDLRKVLLQLKERGKTIFFSSHELTEVEDLCDRVLMVHRGRCIEQKRVEELIHPLNRFTIRFQPGEGTVVSDLIGAMGKLTRENGHYNCEVEGAERYASTLKRLADSGATILEAQTEHVSLEQYFMNAIRRAEEKAEQVSH